MNTQVVVSTQAYVVDDKVANEAWLLASVELANGTWLILTGKETRRYRTKRRFHQAWQAIWNEYTTLGYQITLA